MEVIKFYKQSSQGQTMDLLKQSSTDRMTIPNKWCKVRIERVNYIVVDLEYDYDLGVISIKLREK